MIGGEKAVGTCLLSFTNSRSPGETSAQFCLQYHQVAAGGAI